jgi:hypothetical protein
MRCHSGEAQRHPESTFVIASDSLTSNVFSIIFLISSEKTRKPNRIKGSRVMKCIERTF